jgi:hypothetical protein
MAENSKRGGRMDAPRPADHLGVCWAFCSWEGTQTHAETGVHPAHDASHMPTHEDGPRATVIGNQASKQAR